MKVVQLKYKSFTFPLSHKFINSNQTFFEKEIIILKAKDENGNISFGEVSPLPGFSKESLSECKKRLEQFSFNSIKNFDDPKNLNDELKIFDDVPALKFGVEQVLIGLMNKNNFNYFDNSEFNKSIKVNGSIGFTNLDEIELKINKKLNDGISTIKLKIGREKFQDDLRIIEFINKKFNNKLNLRLDVNGKWNYEEAKENLIELEKYDLEYVEQPVKNKVELLKLAEQSSVKIAPDESIQTFDDAIEFINSGLINFIVLKPSIRSGIFETINILKEAKTKNVNPIITTSFETVIGRNMLILLAGMTNHNYAHGLGISVLGNSSANKSLGVSEGSIKVDSEVLKSNYEDLWNGN